MYEDSDWIGRGFVNIFDGFFHVQFYDEEIGCRGQTIRRHYSYFNIELLKNLDVLNNAKNNPRDGYERVRMVVHSE